MKIYLRIGKIPLNEKSKIGETGKYELGVSVWDCVLLEDGYHLVAPLNGNSFTYADFISHAFPEEWYGKNLPKDKIYVVTGNEVGKGSCNEPLLKNVKVLKELSFDYFKYGLRGRNEIIGND